MGYKVLLMIYQKLLYYMDGVVLPQMAAWHAKDEMKFLKELVHFRENSYMEMNEYIQFVVSQQ